MASFFGERYARGQWLVATPTGPEASAALSMKLRPGLSTSAERTRVGNSTGRGSAPLSDVLGCLTAEREGGEGVAVTTTGTLLMGVRDAAARRQE